MPAFLGRPTMGEFHGEPYLLPGWQSSGAEQRAPAMAGYSESGFDGKLQPREDVVSTFLNDRHVMWMGWFEHEIEARYEATGGGLEIIADVLQEGFEDPKCLGLAFADIVTASGPPNGEPFAIADVQKEDLGRLIEKLANKMGLQYPDTVATAAVFVVERTIAHTQMNGGLKELQTARLLLQCLQHA